MVKVLDVVAAIIEHNGNILLARRPETGDQPGYWEFPGGKVEVGESQPQALERELLEELGIYAQVGHYIASHQCDVAGRIIRLHAWHVRQFTGVITALCHSELVWCPLTRVEDYAAGDQLAPADIPLLNAFMAEYAARSVD